MENMTLIYMDMTDGDNQAVIHNDYPTLHPANQILPQQSCGPEMNCLEKMIAADCDRTELFYPTLYF